jgi:NADH-quinone oxidoreductase subunit F
MSLSDLPVSLDKTSLCALGGGVPLPIKNALEHFNEELQFFFKG